MLTDLFFFLGTLYMIFEVTWILYVKEKSRDVIRYFELDALHKGLPKYEYSTEYKNLLNDNMTALWAALWVFMGIFTTQWVYFLVFILFEILLITPILIYFRKTNFEAYWRLNLINSVIGFLFSIFVIINHFHLHIYLHKSTPNEKVLNHPNTRTDGVYRDKSSVRL